MFLCPDGVIPNRSPPDYTFSFLPSSSPPPAVLSHRFDGRAPISAPNTHPIWFPPPGVLLGPFLPNTCYLEFVQFVNQNVLFLSLPFQLLFYFGLLVWTPEVLRRDFSSLIFKSGRAYKTSLVLAPPPRPSPLCRVNQHPSNGNFSRFALLYTLTPLPLLFLFFSFLNPNEENGATLTQAFSATHYLSF